VLKVEYFEKKNLKNWEKNLILWSFCHRKIAQFFPSNNSIFPVKFCPPGVLEDVNDACIILLDHPLPPVSRKKMPLFTKKPRKNLNEKISRKIN